MDLPYSSYPTGTSISCDYVTELCDRKNQNGALKQVFLQ